MFKTFAEFILRYEIEDYRKEIDELKREAKERESTMEKTLSNLKERNEECARLKKDREQYEFLKSLYDLNGEPDETEKKKVKCYMEQKAKEEELKAKIAQLEKEKRDLCELFPYVGPLHPTFNLVPWPAYLYNYLDSNGNPLLCTNAF